jgi:hypothetical protein
MSVTLLDFIDSIPDTGLVQIEKQECDWLISVSYQQGLYYKRELVDIRELRGSYGDIVAEVLDVLVAAVTRANENNDEAANLGCSLLFKPQGRNWK